MQFRPAQAVFLLRGVCKGESSAQIAREIGLTRQTVLSIRRKLQVNAQAISPQTPLTDVQSETDEMLQNAGEKSEVHLNPSDPPRRRATSEEDTVATPIVGTIGRESGQVRLRVVHQTDRQTLESHVHLFTKVSAQVYTDEWRGYHRIRRSHATVCHSQKGWAKDADGDGINEVHTNSAEGMWTTVRNFLRSFRGVHKKYLSGYVAICEFFINLRCISPFFISQLVACTNS